MLRPSLCAFRVVEYTLERGILQCCAVDISGNPIVVEYGGLDLRVVHVISGAGYAGIVPPALPDEFEKVVHAGENIVHEDDRVEVLPFAIAKLV